MNLLSYIIPLEIIKVSSSLNGEIKVIESLGKRTLYANNLEQSGGTITEMWGKAIKSIQYTVYSIQNCLVLGLGGGTVINTLQRCYPGLTIKVIEYDPVMVDIAKNYFGIRSSNLLNIINADAFPWIKKAKNKYDLIIFDLYLGKFNPAESRKISFLKNLKNILRPKGVILYNSHYQNDELEFDKLKRYCSEVFSHCELILIDRYSRILLLGN